MDVGNLAQIASALVALLALAVAILGQRSRASADQHRELAMRVGNIETTVVRLDGDIDHLPDTQSMHRLELRLSEISGDLKELRAQLQPIAATNSRLQDWIEERAR